MSQEIPSRAEIQEGYDAFNRGDFEAFIALHDEEVELFDLAEAPDQRVFRGHAGLRAWIAKLQEAWDEGFVRFEPQSIVEGDGAVVVDTRAKAVGGGSGVPIEMTFYTVLRFRDQKVVSSRGFINRADALEAAGLSEEAMWQENVEIARKVIDAFNRGGVDAWLRFLSPDVVWESLPLVGFRDVYRGRAEAREWLEQLIEVFEEAHLEIEQITPLNDDAVLTELLEIGRGRDSGLPGEQRIWEIVWFAEGMITRRQPFSTRDAALQAAGLRE